MVDLEVERLLRTFSVLENMPRTGWLQRGIPPSEAETVAEHTFKVMAILSLVALDTTCKVDGERMILMGAIHDLTEAVSGDLPRSMTQVLGQDVKKRAEIELFREIAKDWGRLTELFSEYLERGTTEAKIVKLADVLATLRQAESYLVRGFQVRDIIESCRAEMEAMIGEIHDTEVRGFFAKALGPH